MLLEFGNLIYPIVSVKVQFWALSYFEGLMD